MKIEVDLPEDVVRDLYRKSGERGLSLDAYAAELVCQLLAQAELGEDGKIENRPDWQTALARSRADFAAGRVVRLEEVEQWHQSHPAASGPESR
jgi:hypothetical protein